MITLMTHVDPDSERYIIFMIYSENEIWEIEMLRR
jgi:hypothetical protein